MNVILLERVNNLGDLGDEVSVKSGFARNFLLPKKKAVQANDSNRAVFEERRKELEAIWFCRHTGHSRRIGLLRSGGPAKRSKIARWSY